MLIRVRLFLVTTFLLGAFAASASASLAVNISGQFLNRGQNPSWRQHSPESNPLAANSGYAGAYRANLPNGLSNPVAIWCSDLFYGLNFNTGYPLNSVPPTSAWLSDLTRVSRAAWILSDAFPSNISAIGNPILLGSNHAPAQNLELVHHAGMVNTTRTRMLSYNPQAIPEPSTYFLFASALLALFATRKR